MNRLNKSMGTTGAGCRKAAKRDLRRYQAFFDERSVAVFGGGKWGALCGRTWLSVFPDVGVVRTPTKHELLLPTWALRGEQYCKHFRNNVISIVINRQLRKWIINKKGITKWWNLTVKNTLHITR